MRLKNKNWKKSFRDIIYDTNFIHHLLNKFNMLNFAYNSNQNMYLSCKIDFALVVKLNFLYSKINFILR